MSLIKKNKLNMIFIFVILFSILFISMVSAELGCCVKTKMNLQVGAGAYCDYVEKDDCDESFTFNGQSWNHNTGVTCQNTVFAGDPCKKGCSIDSGDNNLCQSSTPQIKADSDGLVWESEEDCNNLARVPNPCLKDCCVFSGHGDWITETECIGTYGVNGAFTPNTYTEKECTTLHQRGAYGACEIPGDCKNILGEECFNLGGTFSSGELCSDIAPLICTAHADKNCDKDFGEDVYWFDSCGNREEIVNNKDCIEGQQECAFIGGSYTCEDLGCGDLDNGESVCVYDKLENANFVGNGHDRAGSEHWIKSCNRREIEYERCGVSRNEICVEGKTTETTADGTLLTLKKAECIPNNIEQCFAITQKYYSELGKDELDLTIKNKLLELKGECENNGFCKYMGYNGDEADGNHELGFELDNTQAIGLCVPKVSKKETSCDMGTITMPIIYAKGAARMYCARNCPYFHPDSFQEMNEVCIAMGDCGVYKNIDNKWGTNKLSAEPKSRILVNDKKFKLWDRKGKIGPEEDAEERDAVRKGVQLSCGELSGDQCGATSSQREYMRFVYQSDRMYAKWGSPHYDYNKDPPKIKKGCVKEGNECKIDLDFAILPEANLRVKNDFQGDYVTTLAGVDPVTELPIFKTTFNDAIVRSGDTINYDAGETELLSSDYPTIKNIPYDGDNLGTIFKDTASIKRQFIFSAGQRKISTVDLTYECLDWQKPTGGDCSICNDNPDGMYCTEYKCKSLGTNCELFGKDTTNPICTGSTDDATAPVIEKVEYVGEGTNQVTGSSPTWKIDGTFLEGSIIKIDLTVDEFVYCKYGYGSYSDHTYDQMPGNYPIKNELTKEPSFEIGVPSLAGEDDYEFGITKDLILSIRCVDVYGNPNIQEKIIEYTAEALPDTYAPQLIPPEFDPENQKEWQYNPLNFPLTVYLDETAECNYDSSNVDYENMENEMVCIGGDEPSCSGEINVDQGQGDYQVFIRCQDDSVDQNTNQESAIYQFTIKDDISLEDYIECCGLEISSIELEMDGNTYVNEADLITSDSTPNIELKVSTSGGVDGTATCYYKSSLSNDYNLVFQNTGSNLHSQTFALTQEDDYTISIKCGDEVSETTGEITFELIIDKKWPKLFSHIEEGDWLTITLDEPAKCSYSPSTDTFDITEGIEFDFGKEFVIKQKTEWNPAETYFIRCMDPYGNEGYAGKVGKGEPTGPIVTRISYDGDLKIKTDRDAICYYDFNSCQFNIVDAEDEGRVMSTDLTKTHSTEWNSARTYYIKCKDKWDNVNPGCAVIVQPNSISGD